MKLKPLIMTATIAAALTACGHKDANTEAEPQDTLTYSIDRFADIEILRYNVPDFDQLSLKQKTLIYYLQQAALEGRDILYDQNCAFNLDIRKTLEAVYTTWQGDHNDADFQQMELYLKRVWVSNGIHHHYAGDKFIPGFSREWFTAAIASIDPALLPLHDGQTVGELTNRICDVMYSTNTYMKRTNQAAGQDLVLTSAGNYYSGVTQKEAEDFYNRMKDPQDTMPVMYGLNSRLVKDATGIHEEVYRVGGRYSAAIEKIVYWLEKARPFAENDKQAAVIGKLIEYYRSGDLHTFDDYCILWVQDVDSRVDFVNGFTESYGDPLGMKASWEANVNFKNLSATKRTEKISANAQWFEDHSPVDNQFKKEKVKGVTAKVITVAILGGDCYPTTPIGINLPNSNWIRHQHGSKSVTIENITDAYDKAAQGSGFNEEFMWSDTEIEQARLYGTMTDNLHTDLHECLGHASGKLLPGVDPDAMKEHGSAIEEARADLFGLYYCADPKMVELGILPNMEAYKAQYYAYMMNGAMTQLRRIEAGNNIEEAHMRNRALVANWVLAHADGAVELQERDGKTFVVVNDYEQLRTLFGQLLAEIQRIKSIGDYAAAANLIETYAVRPDQKLHNEVLARFAKLDIAPYKGFVNPVYTAETDANGNITNVTVSYAEGYAEQNLRYSRQYGTL